MLVGILLQVGNSIRLSSLVEAFAFTRDGKTAYIATGKSVTPVNTATETPGKPIPTGSDVLAIAVTPDGKTVYAMGAETITQLV